MKKIPIVKQQDIADCGPACLASIIKYYDGYVPLEMLKFNSYTSQEGTSAYNLINCAKKYGLSGKGIRVDDIKEIKDQDLPCILHLTYKNGLNHYVVLYKKLKNYVIIMDPKYGKVKKKIEEMSDSFNCVALSFHPIRTLSKFEKPEHILTLVKNIIKTNKVIILYLLILNFFVISLSLFLNYFIKIGNTFISRGFGLTLFFNLIIIFMFLFLIKNILDFIKNKLIIILNKNISCELYESFSNKIFRLPLYFIKSKTSGEIISRYNELSEVNSLFPNIIISSFIDLIMSFVAVLFSITISLKLTLIVIFWMLVYFIIGLTFKNPTLNKINKNLDSASTFNSEIIESINNLRSIKYLNNEVNMKKRVNKFGVNYLFSEFKLNNYYNKINLVKNIIYDMCNYFVISYGLYLCYLNKLSIIDLFTFIMIIAYFTEPVNDAVNMISKLCYIKSSINKISEFKLITSEENPTKDFSNGNIIVSNLSYSYNDLNYIIKKFSCIINKGDKILIQGSSGSGKSTFCQILSKQIYNYKGSIKVNENELSDIKDDSLRKNITYVGQKDTLIVDTIENNIKYERKVDDEEYHAICRICEIDKIVKNKFDCYQSYICESSDNISGGEKQRIALARGLINSGNIIILDESLSEVNKNMEERIIKRIFKYFKDKTILYVSHKEYNELFKKKVII